MTATMVNLFSLNTSSGIPIYRQLIDQIKQAIRMKLLNAGDQLPSVRNLASSLQINPMTISKAFAQLELEGVLIRKRGIGMIVGKIKQQDPISSEIQKALEHFVQLSRQNNLKDETITMLLQQSLSVQAVTKDKQGNKS